MKTQVKIAALALTAAGAICATAGAAPRAAGPTADAAAKGEPLVQQMVVPRSAPSTLRRVRAKRATVRVRGKDCVVPAGTPLAALLRTGWRDKLRLRDYGACSTKPVDSAGLFVKAIGADVNRGLDGWVYKVGRRLGTAGAADPAGPFGNGRLRNGRQVVWFYCVFAESSCQRSLEIDAAVSGQTVAVTVSGYDDAGAGRRIAGATVTARAGTTRVTRTTDAEGRAELPVPVAGDYALRAAKTGLIPSFPERTSVD